MKTRRDFLLTAMGTSISALGVALTSGSIFRKFGFPEARAAADTGDTNSRVTPEVKSGLYAELVKATSDCIRTGELCEAHCEEQLSHGHTNFSKCNLRVHEMLAMTRALMSLASIGSSETPKLAALCADVCRNCAEACAEHKEHFSHGMHLECKACMDSCHACEKVCKSVSASA